MEIAFTIAIIAVLIGLGFLIGAYAQLSARVDSDHSSAEQTGARLTQMIDENRIGLSKVQVAVVALDGTVSRLTSAALERAAPREAIPPPVVPGFASVDTPPRAERRRPPNPDPALTEKGVADLKALGFTEAPAARPTVAARPPKPESDDGETVIADAAAMAEARAKSSAPDSGRTLLSFRPDDQEALTPKKV